MPHAKYKVNLVVTKAKKDQASTELRKHLGSNVTWQELHGKGASNTAPATHYLYEDHVDQGELDAVKLVAATVPATKLDEYMKGSRTKQQHKDIATESLTSINLKKKPHPVT